MQSPESETAALDLHAIAVRAKHMLSVVSMEGTEFAVRVGVPYSTMRSYLTGHRAPSAEFLAGCFRAFGFMPSWLLTGDGPLRSTGLSSQENPGLAELDLSTLGWPWQRALAYVASEVAAPWRLPTETTANLDTTHSRGNRTSPAGPTTPGSALLPHVGTEAIRPLVLSLPVGQMNGQVQKIEYQVIPRHTRPASAGEAGREAAVDPDRDVVDLAGEVAFSFDWLRRNLAPPRGFLATVQVQGDSMATTLLDGETIVIDQGVTMIEMDGIYVLEVFGRRLVKRVQHLFDGTLVLISDNPAYQREEIPRDSARNVRVVGRMTWPRVR